MADGDNILATRRDAFNIGNPHITSVSEPNRLITYEELGEFNCTTSSTAISYTAKQCVRKKDIVVRGSSNLRIIVEYFVDDLFSFETEPAIVFYSSNSVDAEPENFCLLPSQNDPISNVSISKSYNYFGIIFSGHGQHTDQPYFVSGQSNSDFVRIYLQAHTNSESYSTEYVPTLSGSSNGKYIYTLENSTPLSCSFSTSASVTDQYITVTICTIP